MLYKFKFMQYYDAFTEPQNRYCSHYDIKNHHYGKIKKIFNSFSFTYTRRSVQGSSMIITISRGSTWVDKQKIDASQERTGGHLHCVMLLCKQLNFDCYLGDMTIKLVFSHHLGQDMAKKRWQRKYLMYNFHTQLCTTIKQQSIIKALFHSSVVYRTRRN